MDVPNVREAEEKGEQGKTRHIVMPGGWGLGRLCECTGRETVAVPAARSSWPKRMVAGVLPHAPVSRRQVEAGI